MAKRPGVFWDRYLKKQKRTLLPPLTGYIFGIAAGAILFRLTYGNLSQGLSEQISAWTNSLTAGNLPFTGRLFFDNFLGNEKYLVVALLLALIKKANLITILMLTGIRGFCAGFTFALISSDLGLKGLLFNAVGLWPQSFLLAMVLVLFSSSALSYCGFRDSCKALSKPTALHPKLLLVVQFFIFSFLTAVLTLLYFSLPTFAYRIIEV